MFTPEELEAMLLHVGNALPKELDVYLIEDNTHLIPPFKNDVKKLCLNRLKDTPTDFLHDVLDKKKHWPYSLD